MRPHEPFGDTGTTWIFDYTHQAVKEKRSDGTDIVHIRPQSGKSLLMGKMVADLLSSHHANDKRDESSND